MADGSWTVYIGGMYEEHSDGASAKYYSGFGRRIAMRDNARVHYVLADHLGSSTVITSGTGEVEGTMKYYPYGAVREATGTLAGTFPATDKALHRPAAGAGGRERAGPLQLRRALLQYPHGAVRVGRPTHSVLCLRLVSWPSCKQQGRPRATAP